MNHSTRTRVARLLSASVIAVSVLVTGGAPEAQADDPLEMVALGDSQAAGPLVGTQGSVDCLRSDQNWPHVAAREVGATLTDVTCSGAVTADLSAKRYGYIPAQIDAVKSTTDIVTVTIGANDLNLGSLVPSCMNPFPAPLGISCKSWNPDTYTAQISALAPKIAAALQAIHQKAPGARVYLVSYYTYWNPGGCYPIDPIWAVDADWLQSIFSRLNTMLAGTATGNGATFIDLAGPSQSHGICSSSKWVEGLFPTSAAAPYHPNAVGYAAGGHLVAGAIG